MGSSERAIFLLRATALWGRWWTRGSPGCRPSTLRSPPKPNQRARDGPHPVGSCRLSLGTASSRSLSWTSRTWRQLFQGPEGRRRVLSERSGTTATSGCQGSSRGPWSLPSTPRRGRSEAKTLRSSLAMAGKQRCDAMCEDLRRLHAALRRRC